MKRKNIFNALLIAGLLVATPLAVDAAGLGKLKVISALGQPLRAEIDLIAVSSKLKRRCICPRLKSRLQARRLLRPLHLPLLLSLSQTSPSPKRILSPPPRHLTDTRAGSNLAWG